MRQTDFLYREELEAMYQDGHLGRLDAAFSRDRQDKLYVKTFGLAACRLETAHTDAEDLTGASIGPNPAALRAYLRQSLRRAACLLRRAQLSRLK